MNPSKVRAAQKPTVAIRRVKKTKNQSKLGLSDLFKPSETGLFIVKGAAEVATLKSENATPEDEVNTQRYKTTEVNLNGDLRELLPEQEAADGGTQEADPGQADAQSTPHAVFVMSQQSLSPKSLAHGKGSHLQNSGSSNLMAGMTPSGAHLPRLAFNSFS